MVIWKTLSTPPKKIRGPLDQFRLVKIVEEIHILVTQKRPKLLYNWTRHKKVYIVFCHKKSQSNLVLTSRNGSLSDDQKPRKYLKIMLGNTDMQGVLSIPAPQLMETAQTLVNDNFSLHFMIIFRELLGNLTKKYHFCC